MEGCESCTLSHSMDGHRSYVSIFLWHRIILDMQFPNQPIGVKLKVVWNIYTVPFYWWTLVSRLYLPADESYYRIRLILDLQFHNQPLGVKLKVVWNIYTVPFYWWTLVSRLYLPADESYYKIRLILDLQFHNQPLGVKWKVVKVVHCPTLWMDTGLMSLSSCWKKLLQNKVNFGHAIP